MNILLVILIIIAIAFNIIDSAYPNKIPKKFYLIAHIMLCIFFITEMAFVYIEKRTKSTAIVLVVLIISTLIAIPLNIYRVNHAKLSDKKVKPQITIKKQLKILFIGLGVVMVLTMATLFLYSFA
jgi:hypothetical protein